MEFRSPSTEPTGQKLPQNQRLLRIDAPRIAMKAAPDKPIATMLKPVRSSLCTSRIRGRRLYVKKREKIDQGSAQDAILMAPSKESTMTANRIANRSGLNDLLYLCPPLPWIRAVRSWRVPGGREPHPYIVQKALLQAVSR
jgi:hypothetical protein